MGIGKFGRWWRSFASPRPHFPPAQETLFRQDYNAEGRTYRTEMWLGLAIGFTLLLIFHSFLLPSTDENTLFTPLLIIALIVPMVLRGISGVSDRWAHWSTPLFIASVYLDIGALLWVRITSAGPGLEVMPVIVPIAVLITMFGVQVSFDVAAPAMVIGLVGITAVELVGLAHDSNALFNLLASAALVLVALSTSYELEASARATWADRRRLHQLARTDGLTELPNRRAITERLDEAARTTGSSPLMVAMLDIDDFKRFNDTFGHSAGDRCLMRIGGYLRELCDPDTEFAARLGGEEFVIVWRGVDLATARRRAEELRAQATADFTSPDGTPVTLSAGFADGPVTRLHEAMTVLGQADTALYAAKEAGRNRLIIADPSDPPGRAQHLAVSSTPDDAVPMTTGLRGMRFNDAAAERRFREYFESQGRTSRRAIMGGLIIVCLVILAIQEPVLKMPKEAVTFGTLTLLLGLIPAAAVAYLASTVPRWHRYSAAAYIGAVAVILSAQMFQRIIQLPKGFDVVPFLMPLSVLLSLTVARISYRTLARSVGVLTTALCLAELLAFPITGSRILTVGTTIFLAIGATRFAYRLEHSRRTRWYDAQQVESQSRLDPLTRLLNRRTFGSTLRQKFDETTGIIGLALIDLDHFKSYNDAFGHLLGDDCLRAVGDALNRTAARTGAVAGRLGGEEFAIILTDGSPEEIAKRATSIRAAIGDLALPAAQPGAVVTASAGLATVTRTDDKTTNDELIATLVQRADASLYRAKQSGRDRLVVAER